MKKLGILFSMILAFSVASYAQTDSQPAPSTIGTTTQKMEKHHGKGGKGHINMKTELGLTTEQDAHIKDINSNYKGKIKALRTDKTIDKTQKKEQVAAIRKAHDSEIQGVLNADQYAKWQAKKQERRQQMKANRGNKNRN